MASQSAYDVREVTWEEHGPRLIAIRRRVFVQEQGVAEALEWDGLDRSCRHVLAETAGGESIGTGRLLPDGHITRLLLHAVTR